MQGRISEVAEPNHLDPRERQQGHDQSNLEILYPCFQNRKNVALLDRERPASQTRLTSCVSFLFLTRSRVMKIVHTISIFNARQVTIVKILAEMHAMRAHRASECNELRPQPPLSFFERSLE